MAVSNPLLLVLKGLHKTQSLILRSPVKEKSQEFRPGTEQKQVNGQLANQIDDKRHLRSFDDQKSRSDNAILFDFDLSIPKIDYNYQNKVIREPSLNEENQQNLRQTTSQPSSSSSTSYKLYSYPNIPKVIKDPLPDDVYLSSHRRQERDEKRTHNIEKEQAAMDMDNMGNLYNQLQDETAWRKCLVKMVKINDIHDENELKTKRELAMAELRIYFAKYENWRSRLIWNKQGKEKSPEIEVESEPSSKSRKRKSLIIEPTHQKKRFKSFYDADKNKLHIKFDQLIKRARRNIEPFGRPIPLMISREFDIPLEWKEEKK